MSVRHRTGAVVLKINNFKEQDKIISFYSKEFGKIDVVGKAIRREKAKLRSFVQYPYFSEIDFIQGKNHKILTDAVLINNFSNIRKSFKKIIIAYKISQLSCSFIKYSERDEKIWSLVLNSFLFLDQKEFSDSKAFFLYYYFLWNLLSLLGYKIDLSYCAVCQKRLSGRVVFSFEKGLSHQGCFPGELVSLYPLNTLRLFESQNLNIINTLRENEKKSLKEISYNLICQKMKK